MSRSIQAIRVAITFSLFILLIPPADAVKRVETQNVPITVTTVGREAIQTDSEPIDLAQVVRGTVMTLAQGQTNTRGTQFTIRGVNGTPDLNPLVNGQSAVAYIPGREGSRSAVLIGPLADLQRIDVLRGPQGTLFGRNAAAGAIVSETMPALDGCAGYNVEVDLDNQILTVTQGWCDEPILMAVECPTTASIGETVQFGALVSESVNARIEWTLDSNITLDVEYSDVNASSFTFRDYDIRAAWGSAYGANYTFDVSGTYDLSVTATNDYGTDSFSCPVEVERDAGGSGTRDWADKGAARFGIGYNSEFKSLAVYAGGSAALPVEMPLYGEVTALAFNSGVRDYIGLNAELAYRTEIGDLGALFAGGGLHALRQSSNGNSDLELGFGLSVRFEAEVVSLPVQPTVGLSMSRQYGTFIPYGSFGATYWFK